MPPPPPLWWPFGSMAARGGRCDYTLLWGQRSPYDQAVLRVGMESLRPRRPLCAREPGPRVSLRLMLSRSEGKRCSELGSDLMEHSGR